MKLVQVAENLRDEPLPLDRDNIAPADCIFHQPWWLDAVAPGQWEAAEVKVGETVRARMPYVMKPGPLGWNAITMPLLTPYLGPWFAPSKAKRVNLFGEQKELLNGLLDQLPPHDYFMQVCHYSLNNWLPFSWRNFQATVGYTYVLEDLSDLDKVWNGMRDKTRGQIRKAERLLKVRPGEDFEEFWDIHARSFSRQGKTLSKGFCQVAQRIEAACALRQTRQMFFAEDAQGQTHAAIYMVFDDNCVYGLMSGETTELRDAAGASLVLWESIKFASAAGKKIDFCGSIIERIERFLRGFGGELTPYFCVSRSTYRGKFLKSGKDLLTALGNRMGRHR